MSNRHPFASQRPPHPFTHVVESMLGPWQVSVAKGNLRVGDDDRDAAARQLAEHYSSGRLERWEYDERLDAALVARTRGDLARVFRDLPRLPVPAARPTPPPRPPRTRRLPLFPVLLILLGIALLTDSWWVLLVGLGAALLLRRLFGSARAGARGGSWSASSSR